MAAGLPLLGICVGMQLLFDSSEEMGQHEGLHLIPGAVRRFPDRMADPTLAGHLLRVPQIGWNQLHRRQADPLLANVPDGAYAYFAHSYYCDATDPSAILATTDYGIDYPSIVRYHNAWGIQPHPEKSHTVGLRILANFMRMVASCDPTRMGRYVHGRHLYDTVALAASTLPLGVLQTVKYSSSKGVMA